MNTKNLTDENKPLLYDLHLEDTELMDQYYEIEYGAQRPRDIDNFVSRANIKEFLRNLFSFPEFKLHEYLMNYCNEKFKHVKEYAFEQILQLREKLGKQKKFSPPSSPFWNPISPANEEKIVIISLPARQGDRMRNFAEDMYTGLNKSFIEVEKSKEMLSVQINSGLSLWEIFPRTLEVEESVVDKHLGHFGLNDDDV